MQELVYSGQEGLTFTACKMAGTVGLSFAALGDDLLPITVALVVIVISSFGKSLVKNFTGLYCYGATVLLLYFCCLRGGNKGTSICFVGLSDAGKTLLFLRVRVQQNTR